MLASKDTTRRCSLHNIAVHFGAVIHEHLLQHISATSHDLAAGLAAPDAHSSALHGILHIAKIQGVSGLFIVL